MTAIAVLVQPIDRATGERINIRATSHDRTWATRMGGDIWVPAITGRPRIESQFFEGSFESPITAASATLQFSLSNVIDYLEAVGASAIKDLSWRGAPVTIYSGREGDSWPWRIALEGQVNDFTERDGQAQIPVQVDEEPFQADLLTRQYAGTTGAEGPIDLRDDLKPLVIGYCKNVEPVLIDAIDNVWQFSGYGTIQSVDALYERASLFVPAGTPVPDYDDYDALVAADIAPGLWATCLAEGMIRLGAPAAGLITGDVRGHVFAQGYADKPGLLSRRLLDLAGIASDRVNAAAFDAIDAAISTWPNQGRVGASVTGQTTLLDMVHRLVSNANAIATIGNDGRISAHRITFDDAPAITLDTSGRRLPVVIDSEETAAQLPFRRYVVGADISWRVHDPASEIAFQADIIDRGRYDGAETYREGHIVDLADGSRWLYVNPVPSSGNTPQTGSLHWSRLSGPVDAQTVGGAAAANIVAGAGRANLGLAPDGNVNRPLPQPIISGSDLVRGGGGGNLVDLMLARVAGGIVGQTETTTAAPQDALNRFTDRVLEWVGTTGTVIEGNTLSKTLGLGDNAGIYSREAGPAFFVSFFYDLAAITNGAFVGLSHLEAPTGTSLDDLRCYVQVDGNQGFIRFITGVASDQFNLSTGDIPASGNIYLGVDGARAWLYVNGKLLASQFLVNQGEALRALVMPRHAGDRSKLEQVRYGVASNTLWTSQIGAGKPADNATANVALETFGQDIRIEANRFTNLEARNNAGVRTINARKGAAKFEFTVRQAGLNFTATLYNPNTPPSNTGSLGLMAIRGRISGSDYQIQRLVTGTHNFYQTVATLPNSGLGATIGLDYDGSAWIVEIDGVPVDETPAPEGLSVKGSIIINPGSYPDIFPIDEIDWTASNDRSVSGIGRRGLTPEEVFNFGITVNNGVMSGIGTANIVVDNLLLMPSILDAATRARADRVTESPERRWAGQTGADVTATAQVLIESPPMQVVNRGFDGAVKPGQFPRTLTPVVQRGGQDIRTSNDVTYSITTSNVTATINNTAGNANKGRITVIGGGAGSISLTVTVSGRAFGPFAIPFTVQDDPPPTSSGGGGGGGTAPTQRSDSTFPTITNPNFVQINSTNAGETAWQVQVSANGTIRVTAPLIYSVIAQQDASASLLLRARYKLSTSGSFVNLGNAASGSTSTFVQANFEGSPGSVTLDQTVTGLSAGVYDVIIEASYTGTAGAQISIQNGTANVQST